MLEQNKRKVFPAYAGVIPKAAAVKSCILGVSRIRGGDPSTVRRTRTLLQVLPAYAGVILRRAEAVAVGNCVSRIRGGDPASDIRHQSAQMCFPHTRG